MGVIYATINPLEIAMLRSVLIQSWPWKSAIYNINPKICCVLLSYGATMRWEHLGKICGPNNKEKLVTDIKKLRNYIVENHQAEEQKSLLCQLQKSIPQQEWIKLESDGHDIKINNTIRPIM